MKRSSKTGSPANGLSLDRVPCIGELTCLGTMGPSEGAQSAGKDDDDNCGGKAHNEGADKTMGDGAIDETAGARKLSHSSGRDARFGEEKLVMGAL